MFPVGYGCKNVMLRIIHIILKLLAEYSAEGRGARCSRHVIEFCAEYVEQSEARRGRGLQGYLMQDTKKIASEGLLFPDQTSDMMLPGLAD